MRAPITRPGQTTVDRGGLDRLDQRGDLADAGAQDRGGAVARLALTVRIQVSDAELAAVALTGDAFHPECSYTIAPTPADANSPH